MPFTHVCYQHFEIPIHDNDNNDDEDEDDNDDDGNDNNCLTFHQDKFFTNSDR